MADMEIPVNVVTTTLRAITMIPRPERSEKESIFKYLFCLNDVVRTCQRSRTSAEVRADQL